VEVVVHVGLVLMIEELKGKEEKVLRVGDGFSNIIQIGEVQGKEIRTLCSKPKKISSNQIQCINARQERKKKLGLDPLRSLNGATRSRPLIFIKC
jgi:hypothetical protein